jgi:hypothetical protein
LHYNFELTQQALNNIGEQVNYNMTVGAKNYSIRVYSSQAPVSTNSQSTIAVYGTINGVSTGSNLKINNTYTSDTQFQIKVFDSNGLVVTSSQIFAYDAVSINFGALIVDTTTPPPVTSNNKYMLTAWNDLGMHCMDGNDYSVFSVLPPYNNLHAQIKDKNGNLITSGVTVTYQSTTGTDGKINTSSVEASDGTNKTNFWQYAGDLFGASLAENVGLTGNPTASTTPIEMTFNETHEWWEAEGIPITPYNDDGSKNYYPLVKVIAKDSAGAIVASVDAVLPVSDEMDCKRCHASNSVAKAQPNAGWVNNADAQKDYKLMLR